MDEFLELTEKYTAVLERVLESNKSMRDLTKRVIDGKEVLRKILNEDNEERASIMQCSICCERPKVRALNCGHCFCNTCAGRILGVVPSPRCPKCRAPAFRSTRVYIDV